MAPSRRKGANKAAAAAARRKWKDGDLVLAKLKGFPAWPATVNKPQKWGYPADSRKVLVYFFGTQEIAFCNPADVEEFTEEKKVSLLGKRHGKGSDFVRALYEIIDCFEKKKEQDQVNSDNLTEETNITNANHSDESLTRSVNDEAAIVTAKRLCSGATDDLKSLTEAAVIAAAEDALHDEMQLEEAHSNSGFRELRVYSTRNKSDAVQSRNFGPQRRISARRLRSSSRVDASGLQNLLLSSTDNHKISRRFSTNVQDKSVRRSTRIMKSSDDSEGYYANSPPLVSNDSLEENGSEIMTVDSDSDSLNDGSAVDSGCKPVKGDVSFENNEREPELSDRLDFQGNATIIKKKRRPNRKRHGCDLVAKLDEFVSETEVIKTDCISLSNVEVAERCHNEDGDEHLPLLKRARVRMGRSSPAGDEASYLTREEEKLLEVPESSVDRESDHTTGNLDASSKLHSSPARPQNWEIKKNFIDGEAALPPSKRLHRALEAMSANAAEHIQRASSCSPTLDTHTEGCSSVKCSDPSIEKLPVIELRSGQAEDHNSSPMLNAHTEGCSSVKCSDPSIEKLSVIELRSGQAEDHSSSPTLDAHAEGCSSVKYSELSIEESPMIELRSGQAEDHNCDGSGISPGLDVEVLETDGKTAEVVLDCGRTSGVDSSCPELCKNSFQCVGGVEGKHVKLSPLIERPDAEHQNMNADSLNNGEHLYHLDSNGPCLNMSPAGCGVKPLEFKKVAKRSDADISPANPDSISVEEIAGASFNTEKCIHIGSSADERVNAVHKTKDLYLSEKNQDSHRSEPLREARPECAGSSVASSVSPVKVLNSGHREVLFCPSTVSNGHQEDKVVSVTQSSSYATDRPVSDAKSSPPSSSLCNISSSDRSVEKNNSCSNAQSLPKKAELAGKSSSKVELLPTFEAIIRSLTRTKESIGRATRIAIDCAKAGHANKVVDLLAHNLTTESSPPKKIDLFFLIDSIAQCSVGMKGNAGIYPSVIQPLLPRLLLAAAPPGTTFNENHKLCLKVLRVWLHRKILPETIIRRQIRDLDILLGLHVAGGSRRACRFERPFDDPIRGMEGMLVDEYGSNSSIQLPGFCMPPMRKDDDDIESDSDGESFEAVTPEHNAENLDEETTVIAKAEKRSHILEDVDGELEMEDVTPTREIEITSTSNTTGTDCKQLSHPLSDKQYGAPFDPQPIDSQLISARLLRSPPPPPPSAPPPPPPPPPPVLDSVSKVPQSKLISSSQELNEKRSLSPRSKPRTLDDVHRCRYDSADSDTQLPRQMSYSSNTCPFGEQPTSHFSGRAASGFYPVDGAFNNDFHLHPPHPAPSNQFSFVSEQRIQSSRDIPHHPHPNRFHTRCAENGNIYRDRDRNRFEQHDNIGEHWRPPLPSISGPYHHDGPRMDHAPMPYNGPPREPAFPDNRWNFPPRSMNHRQFNPYRPPSQGPIPVANRGPNFWKAR
ncbi:hypothetical protein ACS0TY_012867 [Phlomoides rotata]